MKIRTLLAFQLSFALASLAFLLASAWRQATVGEALSAAPILPAVLMLTIYILCLLLPGFGSLAWYRIAMGLALLPFGVGGVIGNIVLYVQSGIENYASFEIWLLAVAINAYGTFFNLAAVFGYFYEPKHMAG